MSICLPIANIELNNEIEMHFKEYARKWRLEDVLVTLVCLGMFLQNAVNIKTCSGFSMKIENRDVATDT